MPTYDYKCSACGHTFDELQSFSEPALTKCPKCKKNKLERLFGGGGAIIFKGAGFYETDYRRAGETEGKKDTDGASETSKETKDNKETKDTKDTKSDPPPASDTPAKSETKSESKNGGGAKKKK
jgi:putative FmdB family regulatory protein